MKFMLKLRNLLSVARSKQVCIEWLEATALLSIYLRGELILIATKVLPASCFLADVPSSACETPPPRRHTHLADVCRLLPVTERGHPRNTYDLKPVSQRALTCQPACI